MNNNSFWRQYLIIGGVALILVACFCCSALTGLATYMVTQPPSLVISTQAPAKQQPNESVVPTTIAAPIETQPNCPNEAEFAQLTGVVADKVPTEPCAFHWRGDPLAVTPTNSCPEGWSCQLGIIDQGNVLYYGGSPTVRIYAGTWRLVELYPSTDMVQDPCQFLAKSQEEGRNSTPTWTILPGNFSCP